MAKIICNRDQRRKPMTRGERRFADRLEHLLEDDYLCWFDVPLGEKRRFTDFIVLHPARGLLFLEVKDWRLDSIKRMTPDITELLTNSGLKTVVNPLLQARQCAIHYITCLQKDRALLQKTGKYQGKLVCPWGYGVVLTNITRRQLDQAMQEDAHDVVMPSRLVLCKDEMLADMDAEQFQQKLWQMFHYRFDEKLSLPQIERIRWHLFPEIRIDAGVTGDLFYEQDDEPAAIPDIVRVMDLQQEQLARSLGDGHRVIHGVAGSGKTLILGYRCLHLAADCQKPILVLCFNITLARKLRGFISKKNGAEKIHIYHFHEWCSQQLRTYHVPLLSGPRPVWERQVSTVIRAVENKQIPREQYAALLIDEGHDFEADWLRLIVQMVDKRTDSILMLYDDAQSIYRKTLDFSLSSVGIQARGRTTILKINYRNTREILQFAYSFACDFLREREADDDRVPLITPSVAGKSGLRPVFCCHKSLDDELAFIANYLKQWHEEGVAWHDVAVVFPANWFGRKVEEMLTHEALPFAQKDQYRPEEDRIALLTRHSSKGLEFERVILAGVGCLQGGYDKIAQESRLLYVGMTRAKSVLVITAHKENVYTKRLQALNAFQPPE